jgi:uncharacterized protein YjdB
MKKVFFFLIAFLPVVAIIVLNLTISMVSETISISVESISFDENTIITNIGEGIQLNPNVVPANASNKELIWESSNEDVVVVTPFGEAAFINFGSAYVTATTLDGNKRASLYFIITDTVVHSVVIYTFDNQQSVKVGESLQIYSQVFPVEAENKVVYFTSSNQEVAIIDEQGRLNAKSVGTTTIVGTSQDGGYVNSLEIEVYEGITSISLPSYILSETSSYVLDLNLKPANVQISKINLSSDNLEIATVDINGNVVFARAGIVNITAEYENLKAVTQIEYTNGYASSLNVSANTKTINYNEKVWQIDYQTSPQNLYNTEVSFTSSNANVATISNTGLVQLEGGGASIITVCVFKSDGSKITRQITLFVNRSAEEIVIENFTTAQSQVKLNFKTLPSDANSTEFYFKTQSSFASVDSQGNISFTQAGQAEFTIFSGSENSSVSKTVKVTYTGGYGTGFEIEKDITINANSNTYLQATFTPLDIVKKDMSYEIISQIGNDGINSGVLTVSENGIVTGIKGGVGQIKVCLEITGGEVISKIVNVTVLQFASEIKIDVDLEKLSNIYISGQQNVSFSTNVLPNSATDKTLKLEITENPLAASLIGGKVVFNYPATITLKATNLASGISTFVQIRYTNTILQAKFKSFPTSVKVGQVVKVEVESYLPSNLSAEISLRKNNETTKVNGAVVALMQNQITGVNGGNANIAVYIGGIYQTSFNIEVIRLAQSLEVYPINIQISTQSINLNYSIFPIDTTSTEVIFSVLSSSNAYIENNVLYFNDYSLAEITASVNDESQTSVSFTIERILSSPESLPPTQQEIEMFVDDALQLSKEPNTDVTYEIITENNQSIIEINSTGIIKALNAGSAILKYKIYNIYGVLIQSYNIDFKVFETVKQITLSNDNFDFHNGEYVTALSENELNYNLFPNINVKTGVDFELLSTTIATIENNKLIFFGEGNVRLKAVSQDKNSTSIWTVRYTGGYARDYQLNVDDIVNISKGQQLLIKVTKWIPFNTTNKNLMLQTLSSDALDYILIEGNSITGKKGGTVQLLLRISDILTKTLTVNINEEVESINFANDKVLIAESNYLLSPIIAPISATNKTLVFEIDNAQIASISNNQVIFTWPGTIVVTARSLEKFEIFDTIEITYTAGYPNSINLNTNELSLFTGESFNLVVSSFTPNSANAFDVYYQIISETRLTESQVLTVNQRGQIKAISAGSAVVRVSVPNNYEMEIFQDVLINVLPFTNSLSVNFKTSMSTYNNIFVTGQKEVLFDIVAMPSNVSTLDYQITNLQPDLATVNKGSITFLKTGILNLAFTSLINPNAKLNFSINYVNNSYIYVEVNEDEFEFVNNKKQISLSAGSVFEFEILNALPSNIDVRNIVISEVTSSPNSQGLKVAEISDGKINLQNGGKVEVNLIINNYNLGNYSFEVIRKATQLETPFTEIFTALPYYEIVASLLPADSSFKTITFESLNTNIATVNPIGQVEFVSTGTVSIVLTSAPNNLSKTITIKYTREIQSITFEKPEMTLSVNSTTLLMPLVFPAGIDGYKIVYVSDNDSVATVNETGRVITNQIEGEVIITAFVQGNQSVSSSVKIKVIKYITNIALELDLVDDDKGIAGKRVFGNLFYNSINEIVGTYQMRLLSIVPSDSNDTLVWSSSNTNIAQVDQTGLVTFFGDGLVTIRVQPTNQYNPTRPVYDSYTFVVVNGINIYNFEHFILSMKSEYAAVLQDDAIITDALITKYSLNEIEITANIYGNGHLLSAQGFSPSQHKFKIARDNIVIDNLVLRGESMEGGATLDDMARGKILLLISDASNVVIKNSLIENAYTLLRIFGSKVFIGGTIFQNAGFVHIHLSHVADSSKQNVVTIKNTVYKDALISAILFDFDSSKTNTYASKLIVEGAFLVYNFRQPSEFMSPALMAKVPEILRGILTSNTNALLSFLNYIKHSYNGKEYIHTAILSVDVSYTIDSKKSPGTVDMTQNATNYYRLYEATNSITALSVTLRIYTIMPGNDVLTPDSTFDSSIYKTIREN